MMRPFQAGTLVLCVLSFAALLGAAACSPSHHDHAAHEHEHTHDDEDIQGGIPVPPAVRDNLGITFVSVDRRAVTASRRLPGEFELLPGARREYRVPLAGRVTVHVAEFDPVQQGDLLITVDSPEWRRVQHEAVEAEGEIAMARAHLAVARARRTEAAQLLDQQGRRVENLAALEIRKADLEAEVSGLRHSLPRLDAEVRGEEAALAEAIEHYESRLKVLSALSGKDEATLLADHEGKPRWRSLSVLEVRAHEPATVEHIGVAQGTWLDEGDLVLTAMNPDAVRFRAKAPQVDLALFRDGMSAEVIPLRASPDGGQHPMPGRIRLGLTALDADRTLPIYMTPEALAPWARSGVAGYLDVRLTEDAPARLAIPADAVIQDGLERVFFRRDPNDANRVLRVVGDLGQSDGRWVEVRSGLMDGDQVVLDGVYALNLTDSARQAPEGYHYHADGTLHRDH